MVYSPRGLIVRGGSMEPTLRDGDSLVIAPTDFSGVRWGDMLTYVSPAAEQPAAMELTHRVIWIDRRGGRIWLRGDAGGHIDRLEPAADGQYWRVTGISRGGAGMTRPGRWRAWWRAARSLAGAALLKWGDRRRGLESAARSKS